MTTVLLTGAGGQIGSAVRSLLSVHGLMATCFTHQQLDITDEDAVRACVEGTRPSFIVNAAAYTDVDKAETEPDRARAVNATGPRTLAVAAAAARAALIHISTDYVFDGPKARPWTEADPVNPLTVYGATKAAGEDMVRELLARHLILRTSWVFGTTGSNFVRTMLRLGRERDTLRVVSDQQGCPTGADDVAQALIFIIRRIRTDCNEGPWGTFHFACRGETTWYGLAERIFSTAGPYWGRRPSVEAIRTADYPTLAERPAYSVLDCRRFDRTFGLPRRNWEIAVDATVRRLLVDEI